MNILYISKYAIFPEQGSPTRQYFLSKNLAEAGNNAMVINSRSSLGEVVPFNGLYKENIEGTLQKITLNGPEIESGFNLNRLKSWLIFEYNLFRFRKKIKAFKPDVVIVSSLSILTFLYGVFLKKWLKIPLVVEVRDIYPLTLVEVGGYSPNHPVVRLLGWIEKTGYNNADLIISTLPNAREHIASVVKKQINYKWVPMGCDLSYYANMDEKTLTESDFEREEGCFYVCYVGTIGLVDALNIVFEAAERLRDSHPQIKFVFIGKGPLKAQYKEQYKNYNNIIIKDPISKKALLPFIGKMDLMVMNLKKLPIYRFGISPNKWMDYMIAKKPILNAYSGYQSIINEAACGIFVEAENVNALKDAVIKFYNTPKAELDKMGENGYNYLINNLDYKVLAKDLYYELSKLKK